jgi:ribonucleoside-diphosphate reductase alpha chain
MADAEAMGRLISLALRSGIPLMEIHRQLRGISSDRAVGLGPNKVLSVPDAIGIALEEWWRDRVQGVQEDLLAQGGAQGFGPPRVSQPVQQVTDEMPVVSTPPGGVSGVGGVQGEMELVGYDSGQAFMGTCPDCGSQLEYAEGCVKCHVCGFSECG